MGASSSLSLELFDHMNRSIVPFAWLLALTALVAWGAVGYAATAVLTAARGQGEVAAEVVQQSDRAAFNQRLQLLAGETKTERELLDAITGYDIVAIATEIESVGKRVGVEVEISAATPAGSTELPRDVRATTYNFIVTASGSFAALMQVASLFEHLPLISNIDSLDVAHASDSEEGAWRLIAHVKVLTTAHTP